MKQFGIALNSSTHEMLLAAYSEKHRAYHTLDHIDACFKHLETVIKQATYSHEIELALWFHDVVYKPFSGTNEEDSAILAVNFLAKNQVSSEIIERVHNLIILTKEHQAPSSIDEKLMLDIDLSILGTEPHVYARFEKDVRKEYKRVPAFIFKKKRKEILGAFLNKPTLYYTHHFKNLLEAPARRNLNWALENL